MIEGRPRRQLVVFVDAMEWRVVQRWAAEGRLPTLASMIAGGARGELSTTAEQLPDTVWASIYTAANPAKLEKYFYVQYDAARRDLRHVHDDEISAIPVWDHLSREGLRVGVADAPKFPLSRSLNGFQLTNWGAHATKTPRASIPAGLLGEVEARFGHHPVGDCDATDSHPDALRGLRARVLAGVELHGELFRWLMTEREWDVFFAGFSAPHCIGHHFWHWVEPNGAGRAGATSDGLADAVESVYRAVDAQIGAMMSVAGGDTRVMVVSGHGMGPMYHASWNLPEILELLGYGSRPTARPAADAQVARRSPWRTLKRILPGRVQYAIKGALPQALQDELLFRWYAGRRDWEGHRAFAVPNNDSVGAIRISVRGRDKGGLVEPGDEYRRICSEIADALGELVDPVSGRPLVKRVTRSHEVFHGPHLDGLPDLTVLWDQSFAWQALHSPRFGTLRLRQQDARTGSHTDYGFVLATGPGVAPGREIHGASIYDVAPTVLDGAGIGTPDAMDGRPLALRSDRAS